MLDEALKTPTPELLESLAKFDRDFPRDLPWAGLKPDAVTSSSGAEYAINDDQSVLVSKPPKTDTTTVLLPAPAGPLSALRLEVLPDRHSPGTVPATRVAIS